MSSERNQRKDSSDPAPASSRHASAPAPSIWGAARAALAAVYNLDALLRSPTVSDPTLLDLLPELRANSDVLRELFARARGMDSAAEAVAAFGGARLSELDSLLDAVARGDPGRSSLAPSVRVLADELDASAAMLALLDRASAPVQTDVSVNLIVSETSRMSWGGGGRDLPVRFDEASPDGSVMTDPYVVGHLLVLAVACVRRAGIEPIVIRARFGLTAQFVVQAGISPGDRPLPSVPLRVLPAIGPIEVAARGVAQQLGATLSVEPWRWTIDLARAGG